MEQSFKPGTAISVKVLSTEGCVNTPPTIERIEKVARELGADLKLDKILVAQTGEAQANRFFGSPTVQVNGVDLEPEMRGKTDYGFT